MLTKVFNQEDGFTLVELLVTIAILTMLFGIISMTLSGVADDAQTKACSAEYHVVKSAIEIYMSENPGVGLSEGADTTISNGDGQFADYLRGSTTGLYSWTTDGVLTAGTCPAPESTGSWGCGTTGH
jgi:prepilin-type N-terminal cleavage/methylation domain-containing protein